MKIKKNLLLLRNDISSLCNQMNKRFDKLEINIYNYIYIINIYNYMN